MFPKINPRELQKAMKRLGINQQEINATEVIIKTAEKNIIIKNPQVAKVNMMGQETFQISGDISESSAAEEINEDDVNLVAKEANVNKEKARLALEKNKGDIAKSILELKKKG